MIIWANKKFLTSLRVRLTHGFMKGHWLEALLTLIYDEGLIIILHER